MSGECVGVPGGGLGRLAGLRWLGRCGRWGRRRFVRFGLLLHEWLSSLGNAPENSGLPRASGCRTGPACYRPAHLRRPARVAELVDALDLGPVVERCGGSSPSARTISARSQSGDAMHRNRAVRRFDRQRDHQDRRDAERGPEARLHADHSGRGHRGPGRDQEVKRIAPQVRMPGFRPGKVPPNLIRKMHGEALQRDALNGAVQDGVQQLLRSRRSARRSSRRSSSTSNMSPARMPKSMSASKRFPTCRRRRSTISSSSG